MLWPAALFIPPEWPAAVGRSYLPPRTTLCRTGARGTPAARSAPADRVVRLQRRPEEPLQRLDDVREVGGRHGPRLDVRLGGQDGVAPPLAVLPAAVRPRHVAAGGDLTAASPQAAKRQALDR